jgi:hypothetical protein
MAVLRIPSRIFYQKPIRDKNFIKRPDL